MENPEDSPTLEELEQRRQWFAWYMSQIETKSVRLGRVEGLRYPCPCCGYCTLNERGGDDICPVCFWQDDGQDEQDADTIRGGPNRLLSLTQARANYKAFGASDERRTKQVRPPLLEEEPYR